MTFGPKWRTSVDGSEGRGYDSMSDPVFSLVDAQPVYLARDGKKDLLVRGKQATPTLRADRVESPAISADGKSVAYLAVEGGRVFVVVDGHQGPGYDWVGGLVFSPAGALTYPARRAGRAFVVVDGKEDPTSSALDIGDPVFSADGARMAYWAYDGSSVRTVVKGVPGKPYDDVGGIAFGPDGRHLAVEVQRSRAGCWWSTESKAHSTRPRSRSPALRCLSSRRIQAAGAGNTEMPGPSPKSTC
jgi:hypothetical protein